MKTETLLTAGRPDLDARFALVPEPAAPFTRTAETELERLKSQMLREAIAQTSTPGMLAPLRRAANEAAALAWLEPYPLLVFPTLFEEKALATRRRALRQELVRARSTELMAVAA
jgi:hypothetical protein